jgi:hypothetical protein
MSANDDARSFGTMPVHHAAASLLLIGARATHCEAARRAILRWLHACSGCFFRLLSSVLINYCGHFVEDLIPDQGLASALPHAADAETVITQSIFQHRDSFVTGDRGALGSCRAASPRVVAGMWACRWARDAVAGAVRVRI